MSALTALVAHAEALGGGKINGAPPQPYGAEVADFIRVRTAAADLGGAYELTAHLLAHALAEIDRLSAERDAAPDLLAFAKALDADWTEWHPAGPDDPARIEIPGAKIGDRTLTLWRACRAAIAKAEPSPLLGADEVLADGSDCA